MGIVTQCKETFTQRGDPFIRFTLMDYSGSFEFALFKKDHAQFKNLVGKDYILMVKGKMEFSERNQKTYVRYDEVSLANKLSAEDIVKGVTVEMDVEDMMTGKWAMLETILSQFPGKCPLWVNLTDKEENLGVKLIARHPFNYSPDTMQMLEDMELRYFVRLDEKFSKLKS
jgi:DNA polymerase-3 subunit alpha